MSQNCEKEFCYSIGQVAKITGFEIHTIRFWTGEFEEYLEFKLGAGDRRYYNQKSVEIFKKINKLIHEDGLKIRVIKEKNLLLETKHQQMTIDSVFEQKTKEEVLQILFEVKNTLENLIK